MAHNTPHTTKSKKKMSDALKEKWKDPEFKSKMNPFKRGCIPCKKCHSKIHNYKSRNKRV